MLPPFTPFPPIALAISCAPFLLRLLHLWLSSSSSRFPLRCITPFLLNWLAAVHGCVKILLYVVCCTEHTGFVVDTTIPLLHLETRLGSRLGVGLWSVPSDRPYFTTIRRRDYHHRYHHHTRFSSTLSSTPPLKTFFTCLLPLALAAASFPSSSFFCQAILHLPFLLSPLPSLLLFLFSRFFSLFPFPLPSASSSTSSSPSVERPSPASCFFSLVLRLFNDTTFQGRFWFPGGFFLSLPFPAPATSSSRSLSPFDFQIFPILVSYCPPLFSNPFPRTHSLSRPRFRPLSRPPSPFPVLSPMPISARLTHSPPRSSHPPDHPFHLHFLVFVACRYSRF